MKDLLFKLPQQYEYMEDFRVDTSIIVCSILACVLAIAAFVFLFRITRKQINKNGSLLGFVIGISVYLIFMYFLVETLFRILFGNTGLKDLLEIDENGKILNPMILAFTYALMATVFGFGVRVLLNKLFEIQLPGSREQISVGHGMAIAECGKMIISTGTVVLNGIFINTKGILAPIAGLEEEKGLEALKELDSLAVSFQKGSAVSVVFTLVITICLMLFFTSVSINLYAAYKGKIKRLWMIPTALSWFVCEYAYCLKSYEIVPEYVSMIIIIVVTAVSLYFAFKLYKKFFKDEDKKREEDKKKNLNNGPKIPRFSNLSNL